MPKPILLKSLKAIFVTMLLGFTFISCERGENSLGFASKGDLEISPDESELLLNNFEYSKENIPPSTFRYSPSSSASTLDNSGDADFQGSSNQEPLSDFSEKKIIKNGNVSIKVEEIEAAKQEMNSLVKKFNASYGLENFRELAYELQYNLRVDIPSKEFDAFVEEVENTFENIIAKNIQARDVTEEFVDLETRLATKESYLKRYREILNKANTVKEILSIEEEIRKIEEEIESTKGRLNYLSSQVKVSKLNILLTQKLEPQIIQKADDSFWFRFKSSFLRGWSGAVVFFLALVRLWPLVILLIVLSIIFLRKRKRKSS